MDRRDRLEAGMTGRGARIGALGFVLLLGVGPVSWLTTAPLPVPANLEVPAWTWSSFVDGRWIAKLGTSLRERARLVRVLRGAHVETRVLLGSDDFPYVVRGRGRWLTLPGPLRVESRWFARRRDDRVEWVSRLRERCDELGVRLLAAPVPDKVRVYPDRFLPSGELPSGYAPYYDTILDELRAAGIAHLDLTARFRDERRRRPEAELFQRRDTHWARAGILAAARELSESLRERGWLDAETPRQRYEALPTTASPGLGDLTRLLGLWPDGTRERGLLEVGPRFALATADGRGADVARVTNAPIALAGDSFALAARIGIVGVLGTAVDFSGARAGFGPFAGLVETLDAIERGELEARTIVWVFIERGWRNPASWPAR